MRSIVPAILALAITLVGCGARDESPTGNTTPVGASGQDAAPGPRAQAAVALNKTSLQGCLQVATGMLSEPPAPSDYTAIVDPNILPPDNVRVIDGENGASVNCQVRAGLDTYCVAASLETSRMNFIVSGIDGGHFAGATGMATISEWDTTSQVTLTGDNCVLSARSVSPGAVWSQFVCADFSSGVIQCRAEGVFVFENCASEPVSLATPGCSQ